MLKIGILGGGNGAFITAADLALKGFNVNLCESANFESTINLAKKQGGINLEIRANVGLKGGFAKLSKIGTDIKELMTDRDIIFLVVPAFAQKIFAEWGAETFSSKQIIVLEPGNFGGSLEFAKILKDKGVKKLPILVEFECMIYSGFKNDSGSVWVSGYKEGLKMAAYPGKFTDFALKKLIKVYPKLLPADNIIETGLSNGNSVLHAPILALNAGWAEQPEMEFLFYWQGCTEAVGRVGAHGRGAPAPVSSSRLGIRPRPVLHPSESHSLGPARGHEDREPADSGAAACPGGGRVGARTPSRGGPRAGRAPRVER